MNVNLLLSTDCFIWPDIKIDRSSCIDTFGELNEVLSDYGDTAWHHPDIYSLQYEWGSLYEFCYETDYEKVKPAVGDWFKKRHFDIIRKLFKLCKDQKDPFCRSIHEMNDHADHGVLINGLLACTHGENQVHDLITRNELVISKCTDNNDLILWEANDYFLPNLQYSNRYLAEQLDEELDTDLREQKLQITRLGKKYCDKKGIIKDGQSKEAAAIEKGTEVARRNFYIREDALSSSEKQRTGSLRNIFSVIKNGRKIYISIDHEKPYCFEVCNELGKHQGEYRFDGMKNADADVTGGHDILIE